MAMSPQEQFTCEFVQKHLSLAINARAASLVSFIEHHVAKQVDSPLELAFAAWWYALDSGEFNLVPQAEVSIGGDLFRLDFYITKPELGQTPDPKEGIVVELDGHEFHERTREQVDRRNYRDRKLGELGFSVLHFSGSEFNRDPEGVIDAVHMAYYQRIYR